MCREIKRTILFRITDSGLKLRENKHSELHLKQDVAKSVKLLKIVSSKKCFSFLKEKSTEVCTPRSKYFCSNVTQWAKVKIDKPFTSR